MMKYTVLPILAAAITLGYTSCDKKADTGSTSPDATSTEAAAEGTTYTVSMTGVV